MEAVIVTETWGVDFLSVCELMVLLWWNLCILKDNENTKNYKYVCAHTDIPLHHKVACILTICIQIQIWGKFGFEFLQH